jgi:integrase
MNLRGGEKLSNEAKMKASEFIEYLEKSKSKSTVRIYKRGLELFSEYYGKSLDQILEERKQDLLSSDAKQRKRFVRELEMFHVWLLKPIHTIQNNPNEPYPLNSASSYCDGIMQLFRFYEMPLTLPSGTDIRKRVLTTKDFVPTPQQYQAMFQVADNLKDKLMISMGKDLAWRIGDFIQQQKYQLPNLDQESPLSYDLLTTKEDVLAKSFISEETAELLKQYLPTLPEDNPYLFPSASPNGTKSHIDDWTINQTLRRLAEKARIVIPKGKHLRFHAFRKRFLSTCANLSIDVNIAKVLCGKDVELDMLTYLSEVEHRKAFLKVYEVLRLTEQTMTKKATPTTELEKRLEDLERLVHGIIALGGRELVDKARDLAQIETIPYHAEELEEEELLKEVGRKRLETQRRLSKEQLEEYKRIIEENNNNH